jgi:hypothetical protein
MLRLRRLAARLGGRCGRLSLPTIAIVLALAAGAALVATVVAVTSGSQTNGPTSSNKAEIRRQLVSRLRGKMLSPRWVVCVPSGRRYQGASVIRCNVNFGDPHIVAYCSVLRGNRLVTNHDDSSIPCDHDDAGWRAPVQTFN